MINRRSWKLATVLLAFCSFSTAPLCAGDNAEEKDAEWIQLFNGKNLDGWTVKIRGHEAGDNFGDTFRVEDGLLVFWNPKYAFVASAKPPSDAE